MESQIQARRLTEEGIERFEKYLEQRRDGENPEHSPSELTYDEDATEELSREAYIEDRDFETRMDFARYLNFVFDKSWQDIEKDQGVWTWLALFYISEICPSADSPNKIYRYVLRGDQNHRHYYRHLVNGPYRLYRLHGQVARTMLAGPLDQHPDMAEQLASRQDVVTNTEFIRVADHLYWDSDREDHKVGATSRDRDGNVRRLIDVHDQLKRTYDLLGMDAEDILALLPSEFDQWMPDHSIENSTASQLP
jgi:hypothetical protein